MLVIASVAKQSRAEEISPIEISAAAPSQAPRNDGLLPEQRAEDGVEALAPGWRCGGAPCGRAASRKPPSTSRRSEIPNRSSTEHSASGSSRARRMPSARRRPIITISSTAVSPDRGHLLEFGVLEPCLGQAALARRVAHAVLDDPAMCAGADAEIILVAPVGEVVPAFRAGAGMVGDFGSRPSRRGELLLGQLEHRRGGLVMSGRTSSPLAARCVNAVPGSIVS